MVRRKISKPREIISGRYLDEDIVEEEIVDDDQQQHYCLRWNNYQNNMTSVFHQLWQNEAFVDVTLACNDMSLKAHKVVLSACSTYFQKLLLENPCKHPIIIMPQDVCYADLKFIVEFVYRGQIDVTQDELQSLLRTADQLKIKGLCELPETNTPTTCTNLENHIELSPVPIVSRRAYSKLRRTTTPSKRLIRHRLSPKRLYTHITGDSPESNFCTSTVTDDDKDHSKMPAVLMVSEEKENAGGGNRLELSGVNNNLLRHFIDQDQIKKETLDISNNIGSDHLCSDREHNLWSPAASSDSGCSNQPLNMTGHGLLPSQVLFPGHVELPPEPPAPSATPVPCPPQDLIHNSHTVQLTHCSTTTHHDLSDTNMSGHGDNGMHHYGDDVKVKFETLRSVDSAGDIDACSRMSQDSKDSLITPQFLGLLPGTSDLSMNDTSSFRDKATTNGHAFNLYSHGNSLNNGLNTSSGSVSGTGSGHGGGGPKTWSQEDMELALDALRNHNMSLTKASATYGIPSTTLWQRAHRLGIDTPKKEGPTKSWTEDSLNSALEALRTGTISANKASKAYGIPSSTLYKIARREGIRLAAPFNAAPTTWSPDDLERALESIRSGQTSVQRASTEFGIPTGTLYGRCKREGIELSRSNPTPWSEDAMGEALEAVRVGQMSINQAAIHYNLPYSSLYGRFKRGKYENDAVGNAMQHDGTMMQGDMSNSMHEQHHQMMHYPPPPPQQMNQPPQQPPPQHQMDQHHQYVQHGSIS